MAQSNPENINLLSQLGFKFHVRKLPHMNWFIQSAMVPGLNLPEAEFPTPFQLTYLPGRTVEFDPLTITFKMDEEMETFFELNSWLRGIGFPERYEEYQNNVQTGLPDAIMSDATLMILNSNSTPRLEVTFKDIFPINVSPLEFNTTSGDVEYIDVTATFRYLNYSIKKLDSST